MTNEGNGDRCGRRSQNFMEENAVKDITSKGLKNFRDIGGVNSSEGYTVRKGMIYRSDALCNLSDDDFETLQNKCHISLVVDLRTDVERG